MMVFTAVYLRGGVQLRGGSKLHIDADVFASNIAQTQQRPETRKQAENIVVE